MPLPATDEAKSHALQYHAAALVSEVDALRRAYREDGANEAMLHRDMVRDIADRLEDIADALPAYVPGALPADTDTRIAALVEQAATAVTIAEALHHKLHAGVFNDALTGRAAMLTIAARIKALANSLPAFAP